MWLSEKRGLSGDAVQRRRGVNKLAVAPYRSLGFEVLATIP
jgi:hypothetical protein